MLKFLSVSTLAIAAASPAFARETITTEESGDTVVVTASRSGDVVPIEDISASVTVIDVEALDQRQTRNLSDVLRDVPGVAVSRQIGGLTQIRIRGTEGNHVLTLIDGIEVSDPFQGEFDFSGVLADSAARVEVLRGQQSSLYGSDAIGGVIHYLTLSGREAPGLSARIEGGSFGTVSAAARAAGVSGDFDYALSATGYLTDGTPTARGGTRNVGSESGALSGKFNWTPSDNLTLTGVLRYAVTDADANNSDGNPASPTFGYTIDSPGAHYRNRGFYGLLSAQFSALDGRWTTSLSGQFADTERTMFRADDVVDFGNVGTRYKGSLVSSLRFGTDAVTHRVTGAVDVEREEFRNTTPGTGSPFDAFTGKRSTDNLGLVAQYELTAGGFAAGASVRHDDNNRFDDATTWRVQGSYRLPTGTRVRGAYGTGVKNPGYYELYGYSDGRYIGNPNLKPEKSEGWEAGIEQSLADDRITFGATYFDSTLKDEIYTTYPAPTFVATPANRTTLSKQHGVELFASARPIPQLWFDASYTHLDADENGVEEVRRPGDIASFNATYISSDERLSTTLTVRHNGRMTDVAFTDPSYTPVRVSLKPYTLVNLNIAFDVIEKVQLFGRVENLFDVDYEEVFSFATPGIGAFAGVRVKL
ncbi:TonB-dependent receptor plug domain-containing protein [Sphingomonas sp.]|uniref:TonB-dependent receptor plug domain-containing protein n=1 Tax=Sphingomonas sp. TaxID=28214 RepID=UPI003BA89BAD